MACASPQLGAGLAAEILIWELLNLWKNLEETMAFPVKCCPLKQSNGSVLFGDLSWASFLTRGKGLL
jgi:hypothetical protein